jgi:hypothetical protein
MCPAIDNTAICEIHAAIHFLHAKIMTAAEIHRELCAVYSQNVMSEGTVRQWCKCSKMGGRTNVYDEGRSHRPSIVSDDLDQSVDQNICKRRCFKISKLPCEFPQISLTLLYEIITVRLGYHKFWAGWDPKMIKGDHKTQRMASAFIDFSERYHKDGDEFLNHIVRVTGDEIWVSFVNVEIKEQSKQ